MTTQAERLRVVDNTIDRVKGIANAAPVDRGSLARVLEELKALAARADLWSEADFPPPEAGLLQARYLVREDDDQSFALYLNVMRHGNRTRIHNHTTWACIAAVDGAESNYLYRRVDDGSRAGYARSSSATRSSCAREAASR